MLFVYLRYFFQWYLEAIGKYISIINRNDKPVRWLKVTRTGLSRSPKVLSKTGCINGKVKEAKWPRLFVQENDSVTFCVSSDSCGLARVC